MTVRPGQAEGVLVRERSDDDLPELELLVRIIHDEAGYPRFLPNDVRRFIASPDSYVSWVIEDEGRILGHVSLHRDTPSETLRMASHVLGQPVESFALVARLFVSPSARRRGVGGLLLDVATREGLGRGLWPTLDVVIDHHAAIKMYERYGWNRIGQIANRLDDDHVLDEYVYVGPRPVGKASLPFACRPTKLLRDGE